MLCGRLTEVLGEINMVDRDYIFCFMNELDGLLELNKTDDIQIEGVFYIYYISRDIYGNIVLVKENNSSKRFVRYNLKQKQLLNNNSDIKLIDEFYNLFIQKLYSHFLTNIYNSLSKLKINQITYSPKSILNNSFFWTIKKEKKLYITIQKFIANGNEKYELKLKKIEGIPNWFIVSKDETFFVNSVNRRLTFYKDDSLGENNLTLDESFISDCCFVVNDTKNYYPYDTRLRLSRKMCPICNLPLIERFGRYGDFLGCQNYPNCRYTEKIT